MTKPMTVFLAFELMKERKIGYGDSISRWLPEFPRSDSITVEHLLRHRSGIPHELVPDSLATEPRTAEEMVGIAAGLPLDFSPGSRSNYSSGGFTVLARILEIASGLSYGELIEEKLFRPLEMTNSEDSGSPPHSCRPRTGSRSRRSRICLESSAPGPSGRRRTT
jgi:CubicO group peptidase (beta-lactamase class C family)